MNNDKVSRNPVNEAGTLKAMHTPNLKVMFSAHILIKKKLYILKQEVTQNWEGLNNK